MSDITKKLRALLAKAEGTTGAESESFMSKVREMMVKHQIEMHTLRQEPDPLGMHHQVLLEDHWEVAVCNAGAEYLGCAAVFTAFEDSTAIGCTLYGRQSACLTAIAMLAYWVSEVKRMATRYDLSETKVGEAMAIRLALMLQKDGNAPATNGTDIVPIDEAKAAAVGDQEIETKEIDVVTSIEARIVAEQISLHLQTGGRAKNKEIQNG